MSEHKTKLKYNVNKIDSHIYVEWKFYVDDLDDDKLWNMIVGRSLLNKKNKSQINEDKYSIRIKWNLHCFCANER